MASGLNKVYSDPYGELAVKNVKYARNCTELYLGNKGIEELRGFERFVNLEVLWLNNNELRRVQNLDLNFRIKSLYLQNNKLTTLLGSIRCFRFLKNLHLYNNKLTNLDKCLAILSRLNHLETLDLFDNPIAQEDNYRLRVIYAMPSTLKILDRHVIKDEERRKAKFIFGRHKPLSKEEITHILNSENLITRPPSELVGELSGCTILLHEDIQDIQRRRAAKALLEQKSRLEEDENSDGFAIAAASAFMPKPSFWKLEIDSLYHDSEQLTEWEKYNGKVLFQKLVANQTTLTYDTVETIVQALEAELGRSLCGVDNILLHLIESEGLQMEGSTEDEDDEDDDDDEDEEKHNNRNTQKTKRMLQQTSYPTNAILRAILAAQWVRWGNDRLHEEAATHFNQAKEAQSRLLAMRTSTSGETKNAEETSKKKGKEAAAQLTSTTSQQKPNQQALYQEAFSHVKVGNRLRAMSQSGSSPQLLSNQRDVDEEKQHDEEKQDRIRYDTFSAYRYQQPTMQNQRHEQHVVSRAARDKYQLRGDRYKRFQELGQATVSSIKLITQTL